jgi:hypothetical protein
VRNIGKMFDTAAILDAALVLSRSRPVLRYVLVLL